MTENKKISKLKTGLISRSLSLAKLGVSAGINYAATKITNKSTDDYINTQALYIAKELGQLKGSLMKAGQMLSVYGEHFLPPEANLILKTLQSDSVLVDWPVMQSQLNSEWSAEQLEQFEIQTTPIGSASMGQVYLGLYKKNQKKYAIKIQYPEVSKAIDSDLAALKKILKMSKIIPSSIDTTDIFIEIKQMLYQELNYLHEAQNTKKYSELIKNDPRYKVPEVLNEFCTKKIIVTEYMEGLKADHSLIQSLSQQRRDQLGKNFLELYFKELFDWKFVQTDPHLGNYKIEIDSYGNDKIILLDFGATKEFDSIFIQNYTKMIKGAVLNNDELFLSGAKGLGFINDVDTAEYIQVFKSFCYETIEPFLSSNDPRNINKNNSDTFNWKNNDLPKRVLKNAFQFKNYTLRTPPHDLVFLDRKTAGVFMFLSTLHSQFNARQIINPFLDKV